MTDYIFWFLVRALNAVKVHRTDDLTPTPTSFAKWIHILSSCCYSNSYQAAAVAKLCFKNFQIGDLWCICLSAAPSAYFNRFFHGSCFQVALLTNTRSRVGLTVLYRGWGGHTTSFLVKVRAARLLQCFCSGAIFFLLLCIPIFTQHNKMEPFCFP